MYYNTTNIKYHKYLKVVQHVAADWSHDVKHSSVRFSWLSMTHHLLIGKPPLSALNAVTDSFPGVFDHAFERAKD